MPRISEFVSGQIIGLLQAGISQRHTAQELGISRRSVQRVWSTFLAGSNCIRQPGSGRPRATSAREDRRIVNIASRTPTQSARQIRVAAQLGRISDQTVRNRLHGAGLSSRNRVRVPMLNNQHRRARLEYARRHRHWTHRRWQYVWFSDESRFCLFNSDRRIRVWRYRGRRYDSQCINPIRAFNGGSIMVWGAVSYNSRTELVIVPGPALNAQRYVQEVLRPHILPLRRRQGAEFVFMHDNARPHTAALTRDFLAESNITILPHPPMSPDLNPIEHVWDLMNRELRNLETAPTNLMQLGEALINIWNNIPQDAIRSCINMQNRLQEVLRMRGGNTHY